MAIQFAEGGCRPCTTTLLERVHVLKLIYVFISTKKWAKARQETLHLLLEGSFFRSMIQNVPSTPSPPSDSSYSNKRDARRIGWQDSRTFYILLIPLSWKFFFFRFFILYSEKLSFSAHYQVKERGGKKMSKTFCRAETYIDVM